MSLSTSYVLVTGTNGGLGLGICSRLIDDFLINKPQSASLVLIFTTRSPRKSTDTLKLLQARLTKHDPSARKRIVFQPEHVELTNLLSVQDLARKLNESSIPHLDAIILNAGIAGWSGLDWPTAVTTILLDIRTNTTWPEFKLGIAGLLAPTQFSDNARDNSEPPLGQIFCANVFGHYMLAHWLMPLLQACEPTEPGKIIWVSSIETRARHFNEDDFQGVESHAAYEHSKRTTDIIALTYDQLASSSAVSTFKQISKSGVTSNQSRPVRSSPSMHVTHPGVCPTSIISLYWIVHQFYVLGILLARLAGSPWATVHTYTAAMVMSWITLTPSEEIKRQEAQFGRTQGGRVKWGSSVTRLGSVSARPSEVEGWGLNGSGDATSEFWWAGKLGRAPGAVDGKKEDVEDFLALGSRVWKNMEELRREWEARIEKFEQQSGKA